MTTLSREKNFYLLYFVLSHPCKNNSHYRQSSLHRNRCWWSSWAVSGKNVVNNSYRMPRAMKSPEGQIDNIFNQRQAFCAIISRAFPSTFVVSVWEKKYFNKSAHGWKLWVIIFLCFSICFIICLSSPSYWIGVTHARRVYIKSTSTEPS